MFLTSLRAYFRYYTRDFYDEGTKMTFIASKLEGAALNWFEPYIWNYHIYDYDNQEIETNEIYRLFNKFKEAL